MAAGLVLDTVLPMAGGLIAGAAIGLERELRGHPAGLRTHALVCLASTVLMLAAARQGEWALGLIPSERIVTDPTRMAHGVLTGIGFLCAGVIVRDGFSIQGLTTAASLWMTSALGLLFGVGLWELGAATTAITLVVLTLFRLFDRYVPRRTRADVIVRSLRGEGPSGAELERQLGGLGFRARCFAYRLIEKGEVMEHRLKARCRGPTPAERLSAQLLALPGVLEFEVLPHED